LCQKGEKEKSETWVTDHKKRMKIKLGEGKGRKKEISVLQKAGERLKLGETRRI